MCAKKKPVCVLRWELARRFRDPIFSSRDFLGFQRLARSPSIGRLDVYTLCLDDMRIIAEARPSHADQAVRDAQAKLLASYIRNVIGLGAEVAVDDPGKLERSVGKARRVVDLRPR
jgi:hypothetical protein